MFFQGRRCEDSLYLARITIGKRIYYYNLIHFFANFYAKVSIDEDKNI